jgi:DNA processing protein
MGITEKQVWLALHKQFSSKPEVLKKIGEVCENVGHLSNSIPECVSSIDGGKYAADILFALEHLDDAKGDLDELEQKEVHVIPFTDERYPRKLKDIALFPPLLYAMGNLSLLNKASIGICGSRGATELGLRFSQKFGNFAAEKDVVVISGFAKGIDTAAHLGVLEADGETVVVLAEGIRNFRIKKDFRAIDDFFSRTLVVSQFYPNHIWRVSRAMNRNKVICGLSEALIVVEAGERGGTIEAGRECIRQGKCTLVVENRAEPRNTALGNRMLIEAGGRPLRSTEELKATLDDIAHGIGIEPTAHLTPHKRSAQLEFASQQS